MNIVKLYRKNDGVAIWLNCDHILSWWPDGHGSGIEQLNRLTYPIVVLESPDDIAQMIDLAETDVVADLEGLEARRKKNLAAKAAEAVPYHMRRPVPADLGYKDDRK